MLSLIKPISTKQKYIINACIPQLFFFLIYKNGKKDNGFGEKKTTRKEFYSDDNKKIFNINDININEILISKGLFPKIINLNEHVIGYKYNRSIKPLYIKLPEYVCRGNTFKKV